MKLNEISTTNRLLLIIVIPLIFYILKVLYFIFAPLMFAFFISLLFIPLLRRMSKKGMPKILALIVVMVIIAGVLFGAVKLVSLTGKEILDGKEALFQKLDSKVGKLVAPFAENLKIGMEDESSAIKSILMKDQVTQHLFGSFGNTFRFVQQTLVMILMTLFFLVLLLAGSINFKLLIENTLIMRRTQTVKTYLAIERSIVKFLKVKFLMSFFTGLGFGILAWYFGLSFPLFWGLFAFAINFVQMIGSVIATAFAIIFAFIELESPGTILLVSILFTGVQVLFGSVIEPVMMGKSFSINVLTVLVMLMFWGYLWGVPGLILSIPITVLIKTLLENYSGGKKLARFMS
ncbi:MAG: AI-2E family transporter [Bacteroidales bacterium]|jgi:predicted PurR-regulated permease PerM|nr:AI-2E family transporter [Bacteroidales bacterium]